MPDSEQGKYMGKQEEPITIEFNHLMIFAKDKQKSAGFLTSILGLPEPKPAGFFLSVDFKNNVTFQYAETTVDFIMQHYAFLVAEIEFDEILSRIKERALEYWADPRKQKPNEYNCNHGGRGLYFLDPSGHGMEIITRPYGIDSKSDG
jgi:catechol 2,3-dioxygenase-like lactoylglutathione lyase family enzyme